MSIALHVVTQKVNGNVLTEVSRATHWFASAGHVPAAQTSTCSALKTKLLHPPQLSIGMNHNKAERKHSSNTIWF